MRYALDHRHPGYKSLLRVLDEVAGVRHRPEKIQGSLPDVHVDKSPLADASSVGFKVLYHLSEAETSLDLEMVIRQIPEHWRQATSEAITGLRTRGLIVQRKNRLSLASTLPTAYRDLVRQIGEYLGLGTNGEPLGPRPAAYTSASDGAPRLFGTDARLRNLAALAVRGPMRYSALRRLTGAGHLRLERGNDAPFGRGGLVYIAGRGAGAVIALDEAYPLHSPLTRLVCALEARFPIPKHERFEPRPKVKQPRSWSGDRLSLFGSPVPTLILFSLARRGWTFEALCCALASGYDRVVVKKAIRRMEEEGLLQGSRDRRPGFGPRLLRIADAFPAREELQALIDAVPAVWPDLGERIDLAFQSVPEKTKVYFRRRGLID